MVSQKNAAYPRHNDSVSPPPGQWACVRVYSISIGNTTVREELMNNTTCIWWKQNFRRLEAVSCLLRRDWNFLTI